MVVHYVQPSYFAVSIDRATHKDVQKAGIPSIWFKNSFLTLYDAIGIYKYLVSYALHAVDIDFTFSEMDVFWSNNPLHVVPSNVDIAISAHSYSHEVNIGFWHSKATPNTARLYKNAWHALASVKNYSTIVGAMDQKVMTALLDGNADFYEAPYNTSVLGQVKDKLVFDAHVKWSYLPFDLFWHNSGANVDAWGMPFTRVASHLSFGLTHPEHRIYAAKALGLWRERAYTSCALKSITYAHHAGNYTHSHVEAAADMARHANRHLLVPSPETPHIASLTSLSRVASLVDHNYYGRCLQAGKAASWHVIMCGSENDGQSMHDYKHGVQAPVTVLRRPNIDDLKNAIAEFSHADVIVLDGCKVPSLGEPLSFCDFDGSMSTAGDFCVSK